MTSAGKRSGRRAPAPAVIRRKQTPFEELRESLPEFEKKMLAEYFENLRQHVSLSGKLYSALRQDFEQAILWYSARDVRLGTALERLDPEKIGGFYSRPPIRWYRLDDAAQIYPLSMKTNRMAMFRLSAYLDEPVAAPLLQAALTFTVKRFPSFATTVKKGFFWYYLDSTKRRFEAEPETEIPCRPMLIGASGSPSFRVIYFQNRISVEFFHILTDGSGGLVFLKTLVAEYLRLTGEDIPAGRGILDINELPDEAETSNDFPRADPTAKRSGFMGRPALQLSGELSKIMPCRVLHFNFSASRLRETAKRKNCTVTAYILSLMFLACKASIDESAGDINIQVPVNMRKYYNSKTLRNLSQYCGVKIPIGRVTDPDSILPQIAEQLGERSAKASMDEMMNSTHAMVRGLRLVPLVIKNPVAGLIYRMLSDRLFTAVLSNLGPVEFPEQMARHVVRLDFVLGTAILNRASCTLISAGDVSTLSISKQTPDPSFEEALFGLLRKDGLEPEAEGSQLYES